MVSGARSLPTQSHATICSPWTTTQVSTSKMLLPNRTSKPLLTVVTWRPATEGNRHRRRRPQISDPLRSRLTLLCNSRTSARRVAPVMCRYSTTLRAITHSDQEGEVGSCASLEPAAAPILRLAHLTTIKHSLSFQMINK